MGDMDKIKEMGAPFEDTAFGGNKSPLLGKGSVGVMINAIQSQLAKGNDVIGLYSSSIAAAGSAGELVEITPGEWSEVVGDWDIKANGVACVVNTIDSSASPVEINFDSPALPIGGGTIVNISVKGTRAGGAELEYVGSISVPVT